MLRAHIGSEAVAPGLELEADAPKRFSSQQCIITLWLTKVWTARSRPCEYEK